MRFFLTLGTVFSFLKLCKSFLSCYGNNVTSNFYGPLLKISTSVSFSFLECDPQAEWGLSVSFDADLALIIYFVYDYEWILELLLRDLFYSGVCDRLLNGL